MSSKNLGRKRPEGAGRKKGTLNKNTIPLFELSKKLGVDPFEVLLMFASEDWKGLGYESRCTVEFTSAGIEYERFVIEPNTRLKAAAEAAQYLYPKRKAIDHSIDPAMADMIKSLESKTDEELLALLNKK